MPFDPLQIARDLVAIPSVNPMGRAVAGPEFFEHRVTDYLEAFFNRLGLAHERQPVAPLRENIVARLDADERSNSRPPLLVFEAHQDTVPVEGMTIEPWNPLVRDGRLFGRGACDIKGGMAAMLAAFARLAEERPDRRPAVVMACTVNEEQGFTGAKEFASRWGTRGSLVDRPPDAVIVAEPTGLDVVVAHKGAVRWRCRTHGRAAHSSQPELGENAIFQMAAVLAMLEAYQTDIAPSFPEHPLCGGPTLSVGTIAGGLSVNTVPDRCTIEIDRRIVPGEDPADARGQVIAFLADALQAIRPGLHLEHEAPYLAGSGLADGANRPLAEWLAEQVRRYKPDCRLIGVPYGTDAAIYGAAGVPTVVFGPGSIAQAHTADEWLPIDELHAATEVLYQLVRDWPAAWHGT